MINDLIIISDFDGTITLQDVNNLIFEKLGNEINKKIENKYRNNLVGEKETLKNHYLNLNITEERFKKFITNNIKIDPNFKNFLYLIKSKQIKFVIVSSGFINYIDLILKKNNIEKDFKVYANKLEFSKNQISVKFLHDIKSCHQPFGICGNCKYKIVKDYKKEFKKVLYIGDGLTDRCVADLSDYLFVKKDSDLEKYCKNNDIYYKSFNSFLDIYRVFKEEKLDVLFRS